MNPYHDQEGRFTSAETAQAMAQPRQQGATAPSTSARHSLRHREAVAAGKDPRRPLPANPADDTPRQARDRNDARNNDAANLSPAEAKTRLEARDRATTAPEPSLAHEVLDLIRHPFTSRAKAKTPPPPPAPAEKPEAGPSGPKKAFP